MMSLSLIFFPQNSPQSYVITPKGGNKPLFKSKSLEDYGMDQNSDDSTDDESAPKKPIPSWAEGLYFTALLYYTCNSCIMFQ